MNSVTVHALAVKLQERRELPPTISYYLRHNGRHHLVMIGLYGGLVALCLVTGNYWLAMIIAAFAIGRQTRDLDWYRSLARDWPLSAYFIDWQKVAEVARSPSPLQES